MSTICMNDLKDYSRLNEYRTNRQFYDVIVKVGERSFPCHRIILASTMEYFRSMFSDYQEAEKKEIELKCVNPDDFERLLTYIYGDSVLLNEHNVYRLLQIAHYFGIQSLEDACTKYIVQNSSLFSSNSVLNILMFASKRNNIALVDGVTKWIAENFLHLSKCKHFLSVSGNDLLQILTHPCLNKNPEAELHFLLEWAKFCSDEDKQFLPKLMSMINLKDVGSDWLSKTLVNIVAPSNVQDCATNNEDISSFHIADEFFLEMDVDESNMTDRKETTPPFFLVTHDTHEVVGYHPCDYINEYELKTDNIKLVGAYGDDLGPAIGRHFDCKFVSLDHFRFRILSYMDLKSDKSYCYTTALFICGDDSKEYNTKEEQLLHEHRSALIYDTEEPFHENIAVTIIGENIYLCNNLEFLMFNCERNEWFDFSNMNNRTGSPNLLSQNNSLYMIGGRHNIGLYEDSIFPRDTMRHLETDGRLLQHYDTREGNWSMLPRMKYYRSCSASCIYNDMIYVSGGDGSTYYKNYNVECFDIKAGKWNEFQIAMPKAKMNHCLIPHDNRLWFFGGWIYYQDTGLSSDAQWYSYNLKNNTWSDIFALEKSVGKFKINRVLDIYSVL